MYWEVKLGKWSVGILYIFSIIIEGEFIEKQRRSGIYTAGKSYSVESCGGVAPSAGYRINCDCSHTASILFTIIYT